MKMVFTTSPTTDSNIWRLQGPHQGAPGDVVSNSCCWRLLEAPAACAHAVQAAEKATEVEQRLCVQGYNPSLSCSQNNNTTCYNLSLSCSQNNNTTCHDLSLLLSGDTACYILSLYHRFVTQSKLFQISTFLQKGFHLYYIVADP